MTTKHPSLTLTVTLRDGTEHAYRVAKMPRHWKSWVMQQLPYGTDFYDCKWEAVRCSS